MRCSRRNSHTSGERLARRCRAGREAGTVPRHISECQSRPGRRLAARSRSVLRTSCASGSELSNRGAVSVRTLVPVVPQRARSLADDSREGNGPHRARQPAAPPRASPARDLRPGNPPVVARGEVQPQRARWRGRRPRAAYVPGRRGSTAPSPSDHGPDRADRISCGSAGATVPSPASHARVRLRWSVTSEPAARWSGQERRRVPWNPPRAPRPATRSRSQP